jgi:hypothetical protein
MGDEYNQVIEDLRSQGRSREYIINALTYNPKYKVDPNVARAAVDALFGESKKKRNFDSSFYWGFDLFGLRFGFFFGRGPKG